jgi:DNA gyrase subunit A
MIKFNESEVRCMGRSSTGVRGIDIEDTDNVVGAAVSTDDANILVVTENGYGKQTKAEQYRLTHRGSKGVKALNTTEKTGKMVGFRCVEGGEDLVIISDTGIVIRISLDQISTLSRNTQGVKLINLKDEQKVAAITTIVKTEDEEIESKEITETVEKTTPEE